MLLSIIIPSFDRKEVLSTTLERIRECLEPDVEVIVIDDASTDGTLEILASRFPTFDFYRQEPRGGPSLARNLGLVKAKGRYYLPIDSDCLLNPTAFRRLLNTLRTSKEDQHLLLVCRPVGAEEPQPELTPHPYSQRDVLLKTRGEVVPVLPLTTLRKLGLSYPQLFAGGEPLLLAELAKSVPLSYIPLTIFEFRTDVPWRISGWRYQLAYPARLAEVFEAYLPYLAAYDGDARMTREHGRVLRRAGVYRLLASQRRQARAHFRAAMPSPGALLGYLACHLLPLSLARAAFVAVKIALSRRFKIGDKRTRR